MASDHDDILRKVRALLAKAEDPACTPEESKTFSAAAQRLIAKYAIEEAILRQEATAGRGEPGITRINIKIGDLDEGSCQLLWMLSRFNRCRAIRFAQGDTYGYIAMEIIGFEHDRELTRLLHQSLGMQSLTEMLSDPMILKGKSKKAKATSFMDGYIQVIRERFTEATRLARRDYETESGKSSDSVSLALVSDEQKVDEWVKQRYPNLGTHRSRVAHHAGAYGAGQAAGRRADLGQGRVGGNRKELR